MDATRPFSLGTVTRHGTGGGLYGIECRQPHFTTVLCFRCVYGQVLGT